jgi:hypothetical protein
MAPAAKSIHAKSIHMVALEPIGPGRYAVQNTLPGMCYEVDEAWVQHFIAGRVSPLAQ